MKTFAFVVHPADILQAKNFWPLTRVMPGFMAKRFLGGKRRSKIIAVKEVRSLQGKKIEGYFIILPLLKGEVLQSGQDYIMEKIIACSRIAENLGASILGLGGHLSLRLNNQGYAIAKKMKIPVTTGNTFVAWSVFESIYRMAQARNLNLRKSSLAIIGATSAVGSLSARKFAEYVPTIILVDKHKERLEHLKEIILGNSVSLAGNPQLQVIIEEDMHKALKGRDIIIIADSTTKAPINLQELKSNAIVCDVVIYNHGHPRQNLRQDINFVQAGLIKLPFSAKFKLNTGLPQDIVTADMAETLLLTLEEKFRNYSWSENINLDNLEEIADIAVWHGFQVWVPQAPLL